MTKKPPVPEEAQSPYPIEEEPHENETVAAVRQIKEAKQRWTPSAKQVGLGAAIGVGSAAIVAGLLYWRGGKK
jgi:hypothetical protein